MEEVMAKGLDYEEFKERILRTRLNMIDDASEEHFIKLHHKTREVFREGFSKLSNDEIAEITNFAKDTIIKWRSECLLLDKAKKEVAECEGKALKIKLRPHLVSQIISFTNLSTPLIVEKEIGVNRMTAMRWRDQGYVEEELETRTSLGNDYSVASIEKDNVFNELTSSLKRHAGKTGKKYSTFEKKLILELLERFGSKEVSQKLGVSYDTIARWKRSVGKDLERKARTPMRFIPVIEIMKKHPGMGPMQIRNHLKRHLGLSMGVNSVRRVMEEHGWVPPYVKVKRVNTDLRLYEASRRNYLWHTDFKHQYVNKCKVYILFIQDDFSRFIVGHALCDGEKIDTAIDSFNDAIRIHGRPETIMSDGGSAFFSWRGVSKFTRMLEDFGIEQLIAELPTSNGKVENLNQQVEKELILTNSFSSVEHFRSELDRWIGHYNFMRVHQGLSDIQVPADRYFPGAKIWFDRNTKAVKEQSLIAETMASLLNELKRNK